MSDEKDLLESDPGALAVARRLAALDLAAQSRVKVSLRARLVSRARRPTLLDRLFPLRLPAGLAAACAAAAVMLLLLRPQAPAPVPAPTSGSESPRPASGSALPVRAAVKAIPQAVKKPAPRDEGVFVSIPAASPFETHGRIAPGRPFVTVPGSALENRPVRIEELFVKPTL